jgi:hypothetical protein
LLLNWSSFNHCYKIFEVNYYIIYYNTICVHSGVTGKKSRGQYNIFLLLSKPWHSFPLVKIYTLISTPLTQLHHCVCCLVNSSCKYKRYFSPVFDAVIKGVRRIDPPSLISYFTNIFQYLLPIYIYLFLQLMQFTVFY